MNIQRYKWPVIVAAGLHGALFIGFPQARVIGEPKVIAKPLPPVPDIIQFAEPEIPSSGEVGPAKGLPPAPEIPDVPSQIIDKVTLTVPLRENTPIRVMDTRLLLQTDQIAGTPEGKDLGNGSINFPKDLDRVPRATAQMPPDYPSDLRRNGVAGSVTVEFDVDTSGRVVRASAVRYTHREFVDAAVRAVLRWHFEPGKRNGRAVPFRMAIPIEFGLSEN